MIVLLDTNILLDVLANRKPFVTASARLWEMSETNQIQGVVSAISFNNIYYIVRKTGGDAKARECLKKMRGLFKIVEADEKILGQAIDSPIADFEDAVQYYCAVRAGASHLITRDPDDFPSEGTPSVLTPEMFLALNLTN